MTHLLSLLLAASCTVFADAADPTAPSEFETDQLDLEEQDLSNIAIDHSPKFGMWRVPTWVWVLGNNLVDLTNATYIWKSGLEWFDENDLNHNKVGGIFKSWEYAHIEVEVITAAGESLTATLDLPHLKGCWSDYDGWVSPAHVDKYGRQWPETYLDFIWNPSPKQGYFYNVPEGTADDYHTCQSGHYSENYEYECHKLWVDFRPGKIEWPLNCGLASRYATTHGFGWEGAQSHMTLWLNGTTQEFYATSLATPAP